MSWVEVDEAGWSWVKEKSLGTCAKKGVHDQNIKNLRMNIKKLDESNDT